LQPDKAGTAPAFPADHPAGTKADRVMGTKDGLTAWEVIWLLFPESEYGSNQSALALWPGGVAWIDDKYYTPTL